MAVTDLIVVLSAMARRIGDVGRRPGRRNATMTADDESARATARRGSATWTPLEDTVAGTSLEKHSGGHGEIEPAAHGELVSYNPDQPSEEWGWHGHWSDFAPRGRFILLSLGVVGLLLMILGNHVSHVENWFLVLIAAMLAGWMVRTQRERKRAERRKL